MKTNIILKYWNYRTNFYKNFDADDIMNYDRFNIIRNELIYLKAKLLNIQ